MFEKNSSVAYSDERRFREPFGIKSGDYDVTIRAESGVSGGYLWEEPTRSDQLTVELYDETIEMDVVVPE